MSKFSVSVEVDKPIQHCWDILMDESRMAEWAIGFQSIETIEGEPMTVGSKHRMVFEERGKELVFIETVKVIDPPREFTFDLDHEVMNSTVSMTLKVLARRGRCSPATRTDADQAPVEDHDALHGAADEEAAVPTAREPQGHHGGELSSLDVRDKTWCASRRNRCRSTV